MIIHNPLKNKEIYKRTEETMLLKYGTKHALLDKKLAQKAKKTCMKKYGVENVMHNKEIKNKAMANQKFNPEFNRSKIEWKFKELLDNLGIRHCIKKIDSNFVDFYLSDFDIVIMIDGDYWHNIGANKIKSIYDAKNDRDFGRIAKQIKDNLFNLYCAENNVKLLRFKESDLKRKLYHPYFTNCGKIA